MCTSPNCSETERRKNNPFTLQPLQCKLPIIYNAAYRQIGCASIRVSVFASTGVSFRGAFEFQERQRVFDFVTSLQTSERQNPGC